MSGSGTSRRFAVLRNFVAIGIAGSGKPAAGQIYGFTSLARLQETANVKNSAQHIGCALFFETAYLSDAIAVAMRLGDRLLDFPEHPDDGRSQTDHDTQEHQRQSRGCEHVQHP
jgi:hypothetical protein